MAIYPSPSPPTDFADEASFLPFVDLLAESLETRDAPLEVVPGRLWNVGRAALSGQSRSVWLVRALGRSDVKTWAERLPKGKSPVLFVAGALPSHSIHTLSPGQIVELRSVVFVEDGEMVLDVDAVEDHIKGEMVPVKKKREMPKRASRAATIDALKTALHEHILGMKSRIRMADDAGDPFDLPFLQKKQLATLAGVEQYDVTRAFQDTSDRELPILYEVANDMAQIRRYSR